MPEMRRFPLITMGRLRMATDGEGVTTLLIARGCPLRCKYCLNAYSWREGVPAEELTARELYDRVKVDNLYFLATGGGVTFGGGEPLMYAEFIRDFREICGGGWRVTVETCLNVPAEKLDAALASVDEFIVDIKDMDPDIYRRYTGADNARALDNLERLMAAVGPERVVVRVPDIPGYNTPENVERSQAALRAMGVARLDVFTYVVREGAE